MPNHADLDFCGAWLDKYHFLKRLGRGAYASVWLADECAPSRQRIRSVAIKVFVDDAADRQSFQSTFANFQLDLKFLATLAPDLPIIQYFNSETQDVFVTPEGIQTATSRGPNAGSLTETPLTAFLIVMEYADGGSLGAVYREEVVQNNGVVHLDHFLDVCTGLRGAHVEGVIHCDIKPSNLLWFRAANKVKIGDFGIARHLDQTRPAGLSLAGTPAYMSPEAFQPTVSAAQGRDIYALGCSFYELLTGEMAFSLSTELRRSESEQLAAFRRLHETAPRPDPAIKAPHLVPVQLGGVIRDMMAVDAAARPTLEEVIAALRKAKELPFVSPRTRDGEGATLPIRPLLLSTHSVHPGFRRERLQEELFFVFVTMNITTDFKRQSLFSLLNAFFEKTYSICEVFGKYDFAIRVWSNRVRAESFCRTAVYELLDNDAKALRVMVCDDVVYLEAARGAPSPSVQVAEVLARLNDTGSTASERRREALQWLRKRRIFIRPLPKIVGRHEVRCLCLVSQSDGTVYSERLAQFAVIEQALNRKLSKRSRRGVSLCRRAYLDLPNVENERSGFIITYVASQFNEVVRVPAIIFDDLSQQRLGVSTLLASKRYFVESDRVISR